MFCLTGFQILKQARVAPKRCLEPLVNEWTVIWKIRIAHPLGIISERYELDPTPFEAEEFGFRPHCYQLQVLVSTARKDGMVAKKDSAFSSFGKLFRLNKIAISIGYAALVSS